MAKSLVIVESPAKAKTIRKYLGHGYEVLASVGHIIDLPPNRMGVDLESGEFTPEYVPIEGKSKVIKEIQNAGKHAEAIYLAPDPDREGEAIAYHLRNLIQEKAKNTPIFRVRFHEITQKAVKEAFKHASELNSDLYDAQQARRVLDRVVGYQISPILWKKVRRGLSAGRVQSVAVRLVVDREREIIAFVSEEYWSVEASSDAGKKPLFTSKLIKTDQKKVELKEAEQAYAAKQEIEQAKALVEQVTKTRRQRRPGPPFITSKLQQDAARAFRFTSKKTMMLAQTLYEGIDLGEEGTVGLITYMRTDSTRVSEEAIAAVRGYIGSNFGTDFLPEKPNYFKTKKSAQEAHEAIRPTSMQYHPDQVKSFLKPDQFKLYQLIWERFVASQMTPAQYDQTQVDIAAGRHTLRATGSVLVFEGFLRVYREQVDEDDREAQSEQKEEKTLLPELAQGDPIDFKNVEALQHFTQPPPRFTEASLVKELEDKGIGRPSTYASILSVIQDKEYVEKKEGRFFPTELGSLVTDLLVDSFPQIMEVAFTAGMEENLDKIEEGAADWKQVLRAFYEPFKQTLLGAKESMRDVKRMEEPTDFVCSKCAEHKMVVKWGKTGSFLGCSGYPACKNTMAFSRVDGNIVPLAEEKTDLACKTCEAPLVIKRGKFGSFLGCSRYPECAFTMPMPTGVKCPKSGCHGEVAVKRSQKGKVFYGCSNYPSCDFVSWDKPVNSPCPVCNNLYLIEKTLRSGAQIKCPSCGYQKN
ncbi:MAG: type I DNA topoisomerase [Myxococcaceae bacterium]|nr:type I DNA topoisomerase [Myxococcaceae bacterium]MBH2006239.1 type I DNA topoisomerase [Myxococcaceae bacterium]